MLLENVAHIVSQKCRKVMDTILEDRVLTSFAGLKCPNLIQSGVLPEGIGGQVLLRQRARDWCSSPGLDNGLCM